MTLWMLKRVLKFFLKKYIGPYIRGGEFDLEQLDFRLCYAARLNDVALNVDAINAELVEYPIALKEGSVGTITLTLLPKLNIELTGVELCIVPKGAANVDQSNCAPCQSTPEAQEIVSETGNVGSSGMRGYSYLPVQEGVRVVANLFERLFFGVHVIVSRIYLAIEEAPNSRQSENGSLSSHCMLLFRIGCAEYRASRLAGVEGARQGEEFSTFTSEVSFQQLCLELVDVRDDGIKSSSSVARETNFFGQPVSIMQDDAGLSGHIKLSVCTKAGSLDMPKVDADLCLEHIRLRFNAQQIQQIIRVICSYSDVDRGKMAAAQGVDSDDCVGSSTEFPVSEKAAHMMDSREATCSKSASLGSQVRHARPSLLPGAKVIADWVHLDDGEKDSKEPVMLEEQFAASTEEFFDCLSGSGLWMWTCSAFSAISSASSFASGSAQLPQEFARQVTYPLRVKIAGLSVLLTEDNSKDPYIEVIIVDIDLSLQVCEGRSKWQLLLRHIEGFQVQEQKQDVNSVHELDGDILPDVVSVSDQPLQALVEKCLPKFPVSLCEGSQTAIVCAVQKKCFLRLLGQGSLAGLHVDAKHSLSPNLGGERGCKTQDVTEVGFYLQPIILWVDASIICMLQRWFKSFGCSADDSKTASSSDTGFSLSSSRKVRFNMYVSRVRLWICSPSPAGPLLSKDHLLCMDICHVDKVKRPTFKLRFSDSASSQLCLRSANILLREGYLYFVYLSEGFDEGVALSFNAKKVLSFSLCSPQLATVDILLRSNSGGGISLAERVWNGVAEQLKGGIGGRKTSSEFAAATATEVIDEDNQKIRDDILSSSSTCISVYVPKVKLELLSSQYTFVVEILKSLVEVSAPMQTSSDECLEDRNQVSISLDIGEAELILHPSLEIVSSSPLEKKTSRWEKYVINVSQLQMLHVVKLGMVKDASYFWLRHGNSHVRGMLSDDASHYELQLLTSRDNALGRGDGGGGNALATKLAGLDVSVISWCGGSHAEDMLMTIALGGCTFMAHGGRLNWLLELITFFSQSAVKDSVRYAIAQKSCLLETKTSVVRLDAKRAGEEASSGNSYVLFSLNLHDAALCYEPGKEAASTANLRAKNTTKEFNPVASVIAAAAVHVSSNAISSTFSKDFEIRLRDVAILLADSKIRRNIALDYTTESLHQAGYVKVAGEAVMEALVHVNNGDGLEWEVKCANNQLRLDTCHDTTAAFGRLITQLQQLFVPEVEHPATAKSAVPDLHSPFAQEKSEQQPINNSTEGCSSSFRTVNNDSSALSEGFLEDAFMFVRGCPMHSCCNCLVRKSNEKPEMFNQSTLLSDMRLHSSLDHWSRDGMEGEDLLTPISPSEELPSFIEDFYVSKKSSLQSLSQSSSCQDTGVLAENFQAPFEDFDMLSTADGSGGWYDGLSFKVVENHVPALDHKTGSSRHRNNILQSSKRRLEYPRSVGRVIFQNLNLHWRLYGGSDWPINGSKDPMSVPYQYQAASGRQTGVCLEVIFHGVDLQHDTFPEIGVYASRLALSIRDVRIYDCSKDAPWKKILGYHRSRSRPRESSAKALNLELESVRPDPLVPLEEYRLAVQLLPLRLHLDQRHINFLTNFFPSPSPPSEQLHLGYEEICFLYSSFDRPVPEGFEEVLLPCFQVCELQPFSIRIDYIPRRVDINALRSGNYAELANLVSWKGIELELKHVRATSVHGWGTLSGIVVGEWLEDISSNQILKLLKGLGPIRPLFAVGSAAAKLVVLPAEHYKRDNQRLFRGMRKGTIAFLRSLSLEAVELGVQLAAGAHEILLNTESALGSVSSLEKVEARAKIDQPGDMREGLQQACETLSQGLERTAFSLVGNSLKAYHRGGTSTAVASALRAVPAAAVVPAAAAAGALRRALLGVRNSLDPEHQRESEEKHSGPPPE